MEAFYCFTFDYFCCQVLVVEVFFLFFRLQVAMGIKTRVLRVANNNLKREGAQANTRRHDFVMFSGEKSFASVECLLVLDQQLSSS